MDIYLRIVKSNAVHVEDTEYLVQISQDGTSESWQTASHWLSSNEEAERVVAEILKEAERQALRQSVSVVSTYSGGTV